MGQTKHTPGPWEWRHRRHASAELVAPHHGTLLVLDAAADEYEDGRPATAAIRFAVRDGTDGGLMEDAGVLDLAAHPDARLIAAAPDLLTELKAVEWSGRTHFYDYDSDSYARACPTCDGVNPAGQHWAELHVGHRPDCTLAAALAKADGRTS